MPVRSDIEDRPRSRRTALAAIGVLVAVVVGITAMVLSLRGTGGGTVTSAPPLAKTTRVARTDLADSQSLSGTLGFGPQQLVKGAGSGTITRLPSEGATIARGEPLYWVNDRPVPVFFGDTPLFRPLDKTDLQGSDVKLVVDNLAALGYATGQQPSVTATGPRKDSSPQGSLAAKSSAKPPVRPTATFTAKVVVALKKWQTDAGLQPTGTLDVGQIAVLAGPVRVGPLKASPGDQVSTELFSVTSTAKVVTVPVDATDVDTISVGADVTVTLPSNAAVPAQVTAISQSVQDGSASGTGQSGPPRVAVVVTPSRAEDVAKFNAATVQVKFTTTVHKGVLAVPVGALVALLEGGYAVQRPDGRLIAVQTGMFSRGMVEISGTGITDGLEVVTTS